jgi:hypothetical protein
VNQFERVLKGSNPLLDQAFGLLGERAEFLEFVAANRIDDGSRAGLDVRARTRARST